MAKKKPIDIKSLDLSFIENGVTYHLIRYYPQTMTIDTYRYENNKKIDLFTIPFAHIPKRLKKIIKG